MRQIQCGGPAPLSSRLQGQCLGRCTSPSRCVLHSVTASTTLCRTAITCELPAQVPAAVTPKLARALLALVSPDAEAEPCSATVMPNHTAFLQQRPGGYPQAWRALLAAMLCDGAPYFTACKGVPCWILRGQTATICARVLQGCRPSVLSSSPSGAACHPQPPSIPTIG